MDTVTDNTIRAHGVVLEDTMRTMERVEQVATLATLDHQALVALHRVDFDWPWEVDLDLPCVCGARWVGRPAEGDLMGTRVMKHTDDCPVIEADLAIDEMYRGW